MKTMIRWTVLLGLGLSAAAMAEPSAGRPPEKPLQLVYPDGTKRFYQDDEDYVEKRQTWERNHTPMGSGKPGPYGRDPFIWIYNAEFAKRFGMPEKWIDPELNGIAAAAWRRMSEGFQNCGWGSKENACQESTICDLEIYVDETKHPLPWSTDQRVEISPRYRSVRFLYPQGDERARPQSQYSSWPRSPFSDPATGVEAMYWGKPGTTEGGSLRGYDRNVFPGLTLIVIGHFHCGHSYANKEGRASEFVLESRPKDQDVMRDIINNKKWANDSKKDEITRKAIHRLTKRGISLDPIDENDPRLASKRFHEFYLPASFNDRIANYWKAIQETEREFYRRALDMK